MKPRPRVYKYLDRGLKKTSVEGLIKPRSRAVNLGRGLDKTSVEVIFFVFAEIHLPKSVTQVHGFTRVKRQLILQKIEKRTSVEGLTSPRPRF